MNINEIKQFIKILEDPNSSDWKETVEALFVCFQQANKKWVVTEIQRELNEFAATLAERASPELAQARVEERYRMLVASRGRDYLLRG